MFFDGEPADSSTRQEVDQILLTLFGTPGQARLPFAPSSEVQQPLVSDQHLQLSAGAVLSDQDGRPQGLFREHCSQCHGITGDGAGPAAALLNPYPRDFRLGKFKFKSTPMRHPPTDGDLKRTLLNGIPGTAMPSFSLLPEEEIDALIDYVKYLSIRGQYERYLIAQVPQLVSDSFFDDEPQKQRLLTAALNLPAAQRADGWLAETDSQPLQTFLQEWIGVQFQQTVIDRWANSALAAISVPSPPVALDPKDNRHAALVAQGEQLFLGKGTCYQCHGKDGSGLGELKNYDDWTNDWMNSPGVNPDNRSTYKDFRQAGALRPRVARPRNLALGIYRGGGSDQDLYLRIDQGIEGSPMPAATALSDAEIWALVAYVRSLSDAVPTRTMPEEPVESASITRSMVEGP